MFILLFFRQLLLWHSLLISSLFSLSDLSLLFVHLIQLSIILHINFFDFQPCLIPLFLVPIFVFGILGILLLIVFIVLLAILWSLIHRIILSACSCFVLQILIFAAFAFLSFDFDVTSWGLVIFGWHIGELDITWTGTYIAESKLILLSFILRHSCNNSNYN